MKKSLISVIILIVAVMIVSLTIASCAGDGDQSDAKTTYEGQYISLHEEVETEVDVLEINQALSYDIDETTGKYSLMSNFVAGKNLLVFARSSKPFEESGNEEIRLKLTSKNGVAYEYWQYAALSNENCIAFFIPASDIERAGDYTFSLRADGYEIIRRTEYLAETKELKVLFVPIKARFDKIVSKPEEYADLLKHVAATFPIATKNITSKTMNTADLSGSSYDLCTNDGLYNVWKYLADQVSEKYDLVVGLVNGGMGEERSFDEYSYGSSAMIINVASNHYSASISHELAHFALVGDEYNGGVYNLDVNCVPKGFGGVSFYDREQAVVSENEYVKNAANYDYTISGSTITAELVPCNTNDGTIYKTKLSSMSSLDASSWEYWITPAVWNQLYGAFAIPEFDVKLGLASGIFENDNGEAILFCDSCHRYSQFSDANLYGYCTHCYYLTPLTSAGNFEFNCRSCGVTNHNTPTYVVCSYENCKAGHRIHIEDGDVSPIIAGKYSDASITLSRNTKVDVIRISGVITRTEDDYAFKVGKIRRAIDSIDSVSTNAVEGVCAFALTDVDGFIITSVYLDLDFTLLTNPPSEVDSLPISFTIRLPDNAKNLVFLTSVYDEEGYSGLKYGGYTRAISSISVER